MIIKWVVEAHLIWSVKCLSCSRFYLKRLQPELFTSLVEVNDTLNDN